MCAHKGVFCKSYEDDIQPELQVLPPPQYRIHAASQQLAPLVIWVYPYKLDQKLD